MADPFLLLAQGVITTRQLPANKVTLEDIRIGDHIYRYGAIFEGSQLTHHGIVSGVNDVIHFTGGAGIDGLDDADILEHSFSEFMLDSHDCYRVIDVSSVKERKNIVVRAKSKLGKGVTFFGGYSPATNNCEHFANWCRTGDRYSIQTDTMSKKIGNMIGKMVSQEHLEKIKSIGYLVQDIRNIFGKSTKTKALIDAGVLVAEKSIESE